MAYFNDKFKKAWLDQSPYLFHLINGRDTSPCETMQKIGVRFGNENGKVYLSINWDWIY